MDIDLILAILHFLLVFALVAILATELAFLRPGLGGHRLARLRRIDGLYGAAAGLLIIVGFLRVFFGATASEFYLTNPVFWMKIGAFVIVGLLSIKPTLDLGRWHGLVKSNNHYAVPENEARASRRFLYLEAAVFVLIPIFASLMARGYGLG
jgi:putative membrane protein